MPVSGALDLGRYLLGTAELAAIVVPLAYAALVVRRLLLPGWRGAPARLVEAITAIALLLWCAELLGSAGLFKPIPLITLSLLVAAGARAISNEARTPMWRASVLRLGEAQTSEPVMSEAAPRTTAPATVAGFAIAAIAVAIVAAAWAVPLATSYANGMNGVDSLWYHLPQSAVFVRTGSVIDLHFTDPYFLNWYYPAHSELLHAVPMLAFERDWLSPLLNHLFLALGLLAAWCIGRPWGLGPATLVAAAIVFASEMMLDFQPGEPFNDAMGLAFFLSAVALLTTAKNEEGGQTPVPVLLMAGLAAGLAVGTKLTMLAPVAALAVGVAVLAGSGRRLRGAAIFITAVIAGGGFWYARNLLHAGNPLPWIDSLGPISLPAPEVALELRPPFSVAHYATDFDVWRGWFAPGLTDSVGPLWPLVIAAVLVAAVFALVAGRRRGGPDRILAVLGGVAIVTLLAYLVTPLTASGPEGQPVGFVWNLRYIGPALALGLVLVPLLPRLRGPRASLAVCAGLLAVLAAQAALLDVWDMGQESWAIASALLVLVGFAVGRWIFSRPPERRPPRVALAAAGAVVAIAAVGAGYVEQDRYFDGRYAEVFPDFRVDSAIALANDVDNARIATAGRGGVFFQFGFYGDELSNEVQWVGEPGPRGAWLPIETCEAWREAVNGDDYDYVVTTYDMRFPGHDETSREREWIRRDPAAKEILEDGPVAVYELTGELDPAGCGPAEVKAEDRPASVAERTD